MADTGYNWGAWAYVTYPTATSWNDYNAPDDGAEVTSEAISLDNKAACEVGIKIVYDTGTPDADMDVYILGAVGDDGGGSEVFEDEDNDGVWGFQIDATASGTRYKRFMVSPAHYGSFKIVLANETNIGVTATTVEYRTATVPAAS